MVFSLPFLKKQFWIIFYLASLGRYSFDGSSLDFTLVDKGMLAEFSALYPPKAQKYFEEMLLFK